MISELESEREATGEIRKRFEDSNDALEFEQNNFEKERKTLQRLLGDEKSKYRELETKSKQDYESFEKSRQELIDRVKVEEQKVRDAKTKWSDAQDKLKTVQGQLNLEKEDCGLTSFDFSNAFNTVNRKVILVIWGKILPEALPSLSPFMLHHRRPSRPVRTGQRPAASPWKKASTKATLWDLACTPVR